MTTSLLDRHPLDRLREIIDDPATPEETCTLIADALEVEARVWYCDRPDCDGEPHEGAHVPHARANQRPPLAEWLVWLMKAGRGFGKTRAGGEYAKDGHGQSLLRLPGARWALVAETFADGRDTMIEGESGLLSILAPSHLRGGTVATAWNRSLGELYLANGAKAKIYSSEKPGSLRGPQHHGAWGDEPAKWRDAHRGDADDTTWSNLLLGLRLGTDPRVVLTTTPKRVRLLVGTNDRPGLLDQPGVSVTGGSTYDNLANLAPTFRAQVLSRYEGTRLGRQELLAEILTDVEGALWTAALIDAHRVSGFPDLDRLVVAVDPAVTSTEDADDTGIVAVGRTGPDAFVIEDHTCHEDPTTAMTRVVGVYHDLTADAVVVEANNGGDYLPAVIHAIDPTVTVRKVNATRGKRTRAEPVHALYEQGQVHHVGGFGDLEDQMCTWVPGDDSPDRLDALVWAITDLYPELDTGPGRRLRA